MNCQLSAFRSQLSASINEIVLRCRRPTFGSMTRYASFCLCRSARYRHCEEVRRGNLNFLIILLLKSLLYLSTPPNALAMTVKIEQVLSVISWCKFSIRRNVRSRHCEEERHGNLFIYYFCSTDCFTPARFPCPSVRNDGEKAKSLPVIILCLPSGLQ